MPVLVGFVPTPEGRAALRRAVLECHLRGTGLIVVNTEQRSDGATSKDPSAAEVRSICLDLAVSEPELQIRRFRDGYEPADNVLEVAEETGAELIVIGLRRRTAVGKLILGGSAQRILLEASCPVLAVKADQRVSRPNDTLISSGFTVTASAQPAQSVKSAQSIKSAQPAQETV